ncbi:MAG: hypothetical protein CM1200mP37_2820 [Chloroflexota bacterium]|nr:MAG: hypothetical protein CM1200mP37_2820 [Chloroflexota bacterium]
MQKKNYYVQFLGKSTRCQRYIFRVPHGERGTVIKVKVFTRRDKDIIKNSELSPGVNTLVRVWVAQSRKVSEGDKMAGRHGNKGIIARILPEEDMPFLKMVLLLMLY